MIEDVEKNSNKSLGDNEIASLMKTLASKERLEPNTIKTNCTIRNKKMQRYEG